MTGGYRFYAEPLDERSVGVQRESQSLQAASPEDLLLILAARVQAKRLVQMANIVDAGVILRGVTSLDYLLVRDLSRKYGLDLPLGILLAQANARWPGAVPTQLGGLLNGVPRIYPALAYRAVGAPDRHATRRGANLVFEISEVRRGQPAFGWMRATGSVLYGRVGARIVPWQNVVRRRLGMNALPDRDGSSEPLPLCGAANREGTLSISECLGNQPEARWGDSVGEDIHEVADRLVSLMPEESHDCSRIWALL